MLRTRWRKVLLDLWGNKARTLLVILAIAVGVFAVGFIASAQSILLRELESDYIGLRAASATIYTQPFDQQLVDSVAALPDIESAEGRRSMRVRVDIGDGEMRSLLLTVIPDYDDIKLDRIIPIDGEWPPQRQDVVIERLSLDFIGAEVGDTVTVEFSDGLQKELAVSGLAFDNSVPGASITNLAFGYITEETMQRLGQGDFFTELRFRVAENGDQLEHIYAVSDTVRDKVERSGREVYATNTPPPGEHWAEDIITTLVLLFFIFGGIILFLAGFLVVNTISALITQQMQQIGVMKLVGARRLQIMSMYIVMVLIYGVIALMIGIPAGVRMGRAAVAVATEQLNVTVDNQSVPAAVIAMQAFVGLLIPLLAALWPVLGGVRTTTHRALNSSGMDAGEVGNGWLERIFYGLQRILPLQRPLIISLRNTIRRKGRLILTLMILVMGTALFISVLTVRDSVELTLDNFLRYHNYDVGLSFTREYRAEQLESAVEGSDGILAVETWLQHGGRRIRPDDTESAGYGVVALPANSQFVAPLVEAGRWLNIDDTNAIVINTFFAAEEGDVTIGDEIVLRSDGRELAWTVVGIVPAAADGNTKLYVNYDYYSYMTRSVGMANSIQIITGNDDAAAQTSTEIQLTEYFNQNGFAVGNSSTEKGVRAEFAMRFSIVIMFLVVMAVLLAIVGGLGLTTTMSINILERIREIGVLRAIGASNSAVRQIVVAEGLVVGITSWFFGLIFAIPLSVVLSNQVGLALLQMPLDYTFSLIGTIGWLFVVVILAALASLGPAQNASRLTIREVLAYE